MVYLILINIYKGYKQSLYLSARNTRAREFNLINYQLIQEVSSLHSSNPPYSPAS